MKDDANENTKSGVVGRPLCPRCGSDKIISRGIQWHCKDCDRYYYKKIYPAKK